MADKTITQLTGATTPLAGTEVLPLVQSGVTKKVAVSDLTAARSVATGPLVATGAGTTNATYGLTVKNATPADTLFVRDDGALAAPIVETTWTSASAANMFIGTGGFVYKSTSSLRYKTNITDAPHGLADVMKLRSVVYKGKNDGDTIFGGLIAEEVHAAGLTEFVAYNAEGQPDALHYGHMVALAFKAIQEQQTQIEDLKQQLSAIKGS